MTRVCTGCASISCRGECYWQEPEDDGLTPIERFNASVERVLRRRVENEGLVEVERLGPGRIAV